MTPQMLEKTVIGAIGGLGIVSVGFLFHDFKGSRSDKHLAIGGLCIAWLIWVAIFTVAELEKGKSVDVGIVVLAFLPMVPSYALLKPLLLLVEHLSSESTIKTLVKILGGMSFLIFVIFASGLGKMAEKSTTERHDEGIRDGGRATIQPPKEQQSLPNPFSQASLLYEPYKIFYQKFLSIPELKQHFQNASNEDQAFAIAMKYTQKGMRRLDDASLENRMKLVGMLLEKVEVETCAVMISGNQPKYQKFKNQFQQQFLSALEELGPVAANEWFDLSLKAIVAEAQGSPSPPTLDKQKITKSMANLLSRLSPSDSVKILNTMTNLNSGNNEDICWAGRTLYGEALKMDVANRSILARNFVAE